MRSLKLSAEEGFVLSRIDGPLSLGDLVSLCGLEESRVGEIVAHLASQGAVDLDPGLLPPGLMLPVQPPGPPVQIAFRATAPSFSGIDELAELPEDLETSPFVVEMFGITDVGVVRTNNEDAFAVVDLTSDQLIDVSVESGGVLVGPRGLLLAVSDGMGGENAGEVASALTLETIRADLAACAPGSDMAGALVTAVEDANARVAEAASAPGRDGMGATFVAVLIEGGALHTAEVGDSRAYVLRQGTLTQITRDQTQIQVLIDQGLMTPETAKTSRAKNIVLQAIGKTSELVVAQRRLDLRHGDRVLLCSDGLTGHLSDADIAQILGAGASLAETCAQLVTTTNARGGKDNVTVLAAEILAPASPPQEDETVATALATTRAFTLGDGVP